VTNVRSSQLGSAHVTDTSDHTLYTCPSGYRTIVKWLVLRSKASSAAVVSLFIKNASSAEIAEWSYHLAATGSDGDTANEALWVVLNAGDTLHIQGNNASGYYVLVSGAELFL
jgi:hypothetical protein